ncbi:MAG: superfamily II DNA or RNA helicase [Cellvibrionaceae bacterium]|jgi:superfamily II DNA or RNA helicase
MPTKPTTPKLTTPSKLQNTIAANITKSDSLLRKRLYALAYDEQRILWVFAVVYEPVTQTIVQDILKKLAWTTKTGAALSSMMARPFRDRLTQQKLLVSTGGRLACNKAVCEVLARQAHAEGVIGEIVNMAQLVEPKQNYFSHHDQYHHATMANVVRHMREALYLGQEIEPSRHFNPARLSDQDYYAKLFDICFSPFDPVWFLKLPETLRASIIVCGMQAKQGSGSDNIICAYLEELWMKGALSNPSLRNCLVGLQLAQGAFKHIEAILPEDMDWQTLKFRAMFKTLQGDYAAALPLLEAALKALRKARKKRSALIPGFGGICFLLALIQSEDPAHLALIKTMCKSAGAGYSYDNDEECYPVIYALGQVLAGGNKKDSFNALDEDTYFSNPMAQLMVCLAWHWLGDKPSASMLSELAENVLEQEEGEAWYVSQSLALLEHYQYKGPAHAKINVLTQQGASESRFLSVLDLLQPKPPWELALNALGLLDPNHQNVSKDNVAEMRLVWAIDFAFGSPTITPKEQKRNKKGGWSKGRNISLKRLHESAEDFTFLSEADIQICKCIISGYGYRGYTEYELPLSSAIHAAVGHPYLYWDGRYDTPIEVSTGEPELIVQAQNNQLLIQLVPSPEDQASRSQLIKESDYRLRLVKFSEQHLHIARILGEEGLRVPIEAKEQALKSINAIAPLLAIQSDIGGGNINAQQQDADQRLYVQIESQNSGLRIDLSVRPLGPDGPYFYPGEGRHIVMAEVNNTRLQTQRDLGLESQHYNSLLEQCPSLKDEVWDDAPCEWMFDEEQSLEALFQLQAYSEQGNNQQSSIEQPSALKDGTETSGTLSHPGLELLWPKGGKIKLSKEAGLDQMNASVRQAGDWFQLEGQLKLDDGEVVAMGSLMELMQNSSSRFIKLSDDTFVSLTHQLRRRLDALQKHGEKQRYHPLALSALDELTEGMVIEGDPSWRAQKDRIQEAYTLPCHVPPTLQAELRDYQQEGFSWLTRLAHWGAGACLADDMGLGKTIQSLALLLTHAAKGPSLILAPTSVCMNWLSEAKQFAPTLNPLRFGDNDRKTILDKAGPFDLIVCSYGLLQTEQARLQEVQWQCIVADEAQALKNANTKRSKAAMTLKAKFKMVTTGTPIENHLGELWSLFCFINPGLLGSLDSFNSRFANPIQNQQDKLARQHLKRLVQPFILRRLKADVLPELPARTEITINVSPSKEEQIFYETLRRKALQNLTEKKGNSGQQQLKVLAEIMRLRRACCHPKLVLKNSAIASSKLAAFGEILDELLENNHRALVFSQFVDHLGLIREYLDERKIHYQYLDGSTSIKKREKAVNSFQNGEGDVFLISLKAGGSGLNLTAADYVVHMDPWWNPAVEDQASDRAHRLGQKRPVTIYRLVTENTIEEKIIALHSQKRDLADSLLEGSDLSNKLSAEQIMSLISED